MTVTIDLNGSKVSGLDNTTTYNDATGTWSDWINLFGSANVSITGPDSLTSLTLSGFDSHVELGFGRSPTGTFTSNGFTFSVTNTSKGGFTITPVSGTPNAIAWQNALNALQVYAPAGSVPLGNETITLTGTGTGTETLGTETFDVTCFCAGTRIRTPGGTVAVEELAAGDLVLTAAGESAVVRWLGRQTVSTFFAGKLRVAPIRIRAGALAPNVPSRDLRVSPDHAIFIDGILVQAGALVNGRSIIREDGVPPVIVYYHVELDRHDLILAEDTPVETFVDNVDRLGFDNWEEHQALHPDAEPIEEMPYPRAKAARQVPYALRALLARRIEEMGLGLPSVA